MNSNHQNTSGGANIEKTCMFVNRLIEIKKRRSFTINNIGMPHCRFFKKSLNEIQVVLVDAKPYTPLDEIWMKLFHATRLSSLPLLTLYGRTAGTIVLSLLKSPTVPLVSEFRQAILSGFDISQAHQRNCSRLNIVFIWRRDYVAHPRNPSGIVSRKIKNEKQLLNASRTAFQRHSITGLQLDLFKMRDQLEVFANSDIIIGMHGAAFGFSLLLPEGSGMIELYPLGHGKNWHMQYLAKWNKLHYLLWTNTKSYLEDKKRKFITVPPVVVVALLNKTITHFCQ